MTDPLDNRPLEYRRRPSTNDRFERNGWIGLAVTLAFCTLVAILFLSRH